MFEKEFTDLSRQIYRETVSGYLTLPEAIRRLKTCGQTWTTGEILADAAGIPLERKAKLVQYLVERLLDSDPGANRDSVSRKVRMWVNHGTRQISRHGVIQLAFALKLSAGQADELLIRLSEEGFHWRDPEELVYVFSLKNGISYPEAVHLWEELQAEGALVQNSERREGSPVAESAGTGGSRVPDAEREDPEREEREFLYTADVEFEAGNIRTVEELKQYIHSHKKQMGRLHNTAYSIFCELMDLLLHPDNGSIVQLENVPVRDIVGSNLYADLLPRIRKSDNPDTSSETALLLSALQKSILENWPDETILSKMLNRKIDVNRKTLILLFLATDGGTSVYGDWREEEQTEEELFEERYERMKDMLIDCGYAPLDPRASFDWMILYCMCAGDACSIDEQIKEFLHNVFLV